MARHLSSFLLERFTTQASGLTIPQKPCNQPSSISTFSMWTRISRESQNETNSWGTSLTLPGLGFQSPRTSVFGPPVPILLQTLQHSARNYTLKALSDHLSPLMGHLCLPHAASFPVSPSSIACKMQNAQKAQASPHLEPSGELGRLQTQTTNNQGTQ